MSANKLNNKAKDASLISNFNFNDNGSFYYLTLRCE
jgi:hypothetical protein